MPSGKSKNPNYPNGKRHIEAATCKELAPRSLRKIHRYMSDCTDEELAAVQLIRRHVSEDN